MIRPRRRPHTHSPARPVAEPLEGRAYFAALAFSKVVSYAAGSHPADLAMDDLNGDGHPDVVVADYGNPTAAAGTPQVPTLSVLFGNGTGGFGTAVLYTVGTSLQSVAVADLRGDGHPDVVAVGAAQDDVYVLLNDGDGTLSPQAPIPLPTGSRPEGVAVADVNGDGLPDILTVDQGTGMISVLINAGNGSFDPPVSYVVGGSPDALAVADLNADGFPDVVTVDPSNDELHVSLNRGTKGPGTFAPVSATYATDDTGRAVTIADTNNDARPDLIVANLRSATVSIFLGNGDGTFQDAATRSTGGFPFAVTSADLNGDNRPELISADSRDNAVGVLVHNPNGGYVARNAADPLQFDTGTAPEAVAAADLNGDGKPDLVTADFNDDAVGVLINQTVFSPLAATAASLTADQEPVQVGTRITLTATVTSGGAAVNPADTGGGVVQFLAGPKVLGIGHLAANGTATITTATLPVGTSSVVARYNGSAHYAGSSAVLDETVLATTDASSTPLLTATAVAITSRAGRPAVSTTAAATAAATARAAPAAAAARPAAATPVRVAVTAVAVTSTAGFVPGGTGAVSVTIGNGGSSQAFGSVTVSLSIAPTADPTATVPLTVVGPAQFDANLAGGGSVVAAVRFRLPTPLAAGSYTISAAVTSAAGTFPPGQVDSTPVAATTPIGVVLVPVPFVPGDAGTAAVTITNAGPGPARGTVAVSLTIAPADDPTAAVAVAVVGPSTFAVDLNGGGSRVVPVRFTVPAPLAAGSYTVSATLTASTGLTAADVSPAAAATATPAPVIEAFGRVPSGQHPTLAAALPDGTVITLSLTGPGTGTFTDTPVTTDTGTVDALSVTVVGTTADSTVSIAAAGGAAFTLNTFTDNYRLGALLAPTLTIADVAVAGAVVVPSGLTFSTAVGRVTLAGLSGTGVTVGPDGHAQLSLGTVTDTALGATSVLGSLTVNSWSNTATDVISAPGISGELTTAGDFGATLTLSGSYMPSRRAIRVAVALGSAAIGGTLDSATWMIGTDVGPIRAGSIAAGFRGTVVGRVTSLTVTGTNAGVLTAGRGIGT